MNTVHSPRPAKNINSYQQWELKVLLACDSVGVTANQLTSIIKRSENSIAKKACDMGISLKRG